MVQSSTLAIPKYYFSLAENDDLSISHENKNIDGYYEGGD